MTVNELFELLRDGHLVSRGDAYELAERVHAALYAQPAPSEADRRPAAEPASAPAADDGMPEPVAHMYPSDLDRCPGYWADGELREGCDDCLRRTSPSPTDRVGWMAPPRVACACCRCPERIAP